MTDYQTILYQTPAPAVARIVMNRPAQRNAQDLQMTYDLDHAFNRAVLDDDIKVIVLAGADPHFSAGHDLRQGSDRKLGRDFPHISSWGGFDEPQASGRLAREQEIYLQATRRWRNTAKPTIAQVQGKCIAGGLMLAWACDLIVASDDATFCDPVVAMGVCGVEWFVHPWELGPRKAKEMLWRAKPWTAEEARATGMVNHVVPRAELAQFVLDLAAEIAAKPAFAVRMTKEAINRTLDIMGQNDSIEQAFAYHHLCHAQNMALFGRAVDPSGMPPTTLKGPREAAQ